MKHLPSLPGLVRYGARFPSVKTPGYYRAWNTGMLPVRPADILSVFAIHRSKTPLSAQTGTGSLCSVLDFPALKRRAIINVEGMRI